MTAPVRVQPSLFGNEEPACDPSFGSLRRVDLGRGAWLDVAPGWLAGHARLFDALLRGTRWRSEERQMYDRLVDTPRLFATLPDDGPGHPVLDDVRRALDRRYRARFERVTLALYRDGNDSVAWHGDRVARRMRDALVATVSVGAPRKFLVRPFDPEKSPTGDGGRAKVFDRSLGWGDLLVMGGSCQRTYQHSVPKVANAGPRIAIMFRPVWDDPPQRA